VVDDIRVRAVGKSPATGNTEQWTGVNMNLDQDLPNYMMHSIPMFSLPQDWLWCETGVVIRHLKRQRRHLKRQRLLIYATIR
jgi:hypothetical protein